MNKDQVLSIVRSVLKVGAGVLVTKGIVDDAGAETIVGAIIGIAGILWGCLHRKPAASS
jgi:hypothetical protein